MYAARQKDMEMLDTYTIETLRLPGVVLMENAGNAVVEEIIKQFPERSTKVVVLSGGGNNGGDGFVIARRLIDYGYSVQLCLLIDAEKLTGDAKLHFVVYKNRRLPLVSIEDGLEKIMSLVEGGDLIVDAMLGTGLKGGVRSPMKELISFVNGSKKIVYSVDIPSGVNADTGIVKNVAVQATKTITFALPKLGFFLKDGPRYIGEWVVKNISVPVEVASKLQLSMPRLLTEQAAKEALPKRRRDGHKGTFGHCLVVGGSKSFAGAPIYTAKAAFCTGVGLVSLAIPHTIYSVVAPQCSEALLYAFSEEEGSLEEVDLQKFKAIAIGPGLGRNNTRNILWRNVFSKITNQSLVIDADGLYYAKDDLQHFKDYSGAVILTPHPGEMGMLTGLTIKEIEENRLQIAQQFAEKYGVYLVLKGHRPIIATPSGEIWINPFGDDSLGKGGSGDVLTGLITSFVTQGASPLEAVLCASYLHGKAGEELGKSISRYGVTPNDVINYIRYQIKHLEK